MRHTQLLQATEAIKQNFAELAEVFASRIDISFSPFKHDDQEIYSFTYETDYGTTRKTGFTIDFQAENNLKHLTRSERRSRAFNIFINESLKKQEVVSFLNRMVRKNAINRASKQNVTGA